MKDMIYEMTSSQEGMNSVLDEAEAWISDL